MDKYTREELEEALSPVSSIISKCEKAQKKFEFQFVGNIIGIHKFREEGK